MPEISLCPGPAHLTGFRQRPSQALIRKTSLRKETYSKAFVPRFRAGKGGGVYTISGYNKGEAVTSTLLRLYSPMQPTLASFRKGPVRPRIRHREARCQGSGHDAMGPRGQRQGQFIYAESPGRKLHSQADRKGLNSGTEGSLCRHRHDG